MMAGNSTPMYNFSGRFVLQETFVVVGLCLAGLIGAESE